jgi:hypothetical protein
VLQPPLRVTPPAQAREPQQLAFACSALQLQAIDAELRQTYRQLSVAVHPDKCSHPLASKVVLSMLSGPCCRNLSALCGSEPLPTISLTSLGILCWHCLPPVQAFAMLSEANQVVQPLLATAAPLQPTSPAMPHDSSIGVNTVSSGVRRDVPQVQYIPACRLWDACVLLLIIAGSRNV